MTRATVLALLLAASCAGEQGTESVRELSEADYVAVQPIMEARCGTLDCHGDEGRALRLYAETGLRAADELRGQAFTAEELAANVRSIAALDDDLLVGKPLAGDLHHVGGDVWLSDREPQVECFVSWLRGTLDTVACTAAAAEVALPE